MRSRGYFSETTRWSHDMIFIKVWNILISTLKKKLAPNIWHSNLYLHNRISWESSHHKKRRFVICDICSNFSDANKIKSKQINVYVKQVLLSKVMWITHVLTIWPRIVNILDWFTLITRGKMAIRIDTSVTYESGLLRAVLMWQNHWR